MMKSIHIANNMQLEKITLTMYGQYQCACGCGKLLGRSSNGVDGEDIEYSYGVGETDDVEGMEWRMFTSDCWQRVASDMSLLEIYNTYQPSPVLS